MKKFFALLECILLTACLFIEANAKNGDVIGNIYSTDIIAYICDTPVPSYNIGGRTVIVIEEAAQYCNSLYFDYDDEKRLLNVDGHGAAAKNTVIERGKVGKITGKIYETDIKVLFNGSYVQGYNIGGQTAVCMEDLGDMTGSLNEEYGYSKYLAKCEWNENERIVSLDFAKSNIQYEKIAPQFTYTFADGVLKAQYTPESGYISPRYDNISDEYMKEKCVIKPLTFEFNGQKEIAGFCFINSSDVAIMHIDDFDAINDKLNEYRTLHKEQISYDDAIKKFNDGLEYKTLQKTDTQDYTFIVAENLKLPDKENNIAYISVSKNGGYTVLYGRLHRYEQIKLEATKNTVKVTVYPFAGPHGALWCSTEYELDYFR